MATEQPTPAGSAGRPRGAAGKVLLAALVVLAVAWVVRATAEHNGAPSGSTVARMRLLRDDNDYSVYVKRGAWAPTGLRPYLDVFSEYPPLATLAFGIPYLFVHPEPAPPRAMHARIDALAPTSDLARAYGNVWSVVAMLAWLATIAVTAALARDLGLSPWRSFLCLAPAALYFSIQRFDPLAALSLSAALLALLRGRPMSGFVLLAVGVLFKIYPVVAGPLAFGWVARRHGVGRACLAAAAAVALVVAGHLPLFALGWSDPGWTADWRPSGALFDATPLGSALAAVDVPFANQGARDTNPGSLPERLLRVALGVEYATLLASLKALRIVQLLPAALLVLAGWFRPTPRTLVAGTALAVLCFQFFHNIYSPQFVLWCAPLLAVAGAGRLGLAVIGTGVLIDGATYLQFPLLASQRIYDPARGVNTYPAAFGPVIDLRLALTTLAVILLTILVLRRAEPDAIPGAAGPASAGVA